MNEQLAPSNPPPRSFGGRFVRWLFRWRTIRRALITLATIVTLIALLFAEENWRGKQAWEKFKREWEAKGERFDLASFIPKPVPNEQNFAMTPFLAPLLDYEFKGQLRHMFRKDTNALERIQQVNVAGDAKYARHQPVFGNMDKGQWTDLREWQAFYRDNTNFTSPPSPQGPARDVLFALGKFDPVLRELHDARRRPHAFFPIHYQENIDLLIPHLAPLKSLSTVLRLRAVAYLGSGQPSEALNDLKLSFRLAESIKSEPLLISHLVQIAMVQISVQSVWEGLTQHRWTEPQLVELQSLLRSVDVLEDYQKAMRGERAFSNALMDKMRRGDIKDVAAIGDSDSSGLSGLIGLAPTGFLYFNQLNINRLHQEKTLPAIDQAKHRVFPDRCRELDNLPELRRTTLNNVLAKMLFPAFAKAAHKSSFGQCQIDLALVACALERHRLAEGRYPEHLDTLSPRFLEKIPPDVTTGEPLKYRRTDGDLFVLYSVGWNQKDDGGVIAMRKGKTPQPNRDEGDWVWKYPAAPGPASFE